MLEAAKGFLASEYERVRLLKRSERGEVWLVSDGAGRPRVMKVMHAGRLPYALLKAHPSPLWPEIVFCAEDADETVVVEEYVSGHTLEERQLARSWLTEAEATQLLAAFAEGFAQLHALGIVHHFCPHSSGLAPIAQRFLWVSYENIRIPSNSCCIPSGLCGTKREKSMIIKTGNIYTLLTSRVSTSDGISSFGRSAQRSSISEQARASRRNSSPIRRT
ncbi:MAG: hypothetical protein SPL39_11560 [Selenomonadaceae bacterium]|nr:hypothetical protein [Selenomonadaceae bacterium]